MVLPKNSLKQSIQTILSTLVRFQQIISFSVPDDSVIVKNILTQSSLCQKGDAYLAIQGVHVDGNIFVSDMIQKGIGLVITDSPDTFSQIYQSSTPVILVREARPTWSILSALQFQFPQESLKIHGVTGTNGKTSTVWITRHLLVLLGVPCLSIGTLGAFFPEKKERTTHTTPDPDVLFDFFSQCKEQDIEHVVMEVSSHSIVQKKLFGTKLDTAVFTNFQSDHLDFHGTREKYWEAKESLFLNDLKEDATIILERDVYKRLKNKLTHQKILSYSHHNFSDNAFSKISYRSITPSVTELSFSFENKSYIGQIPFTGSHSVENFLAALLVSHNITQKILDPNKWIHIPQVPGRLENIVSRHHNSLHPAVFVDYAHNADGLLKVLQHLKSMATSRLITVFGCGGDRDKEKRPLMGSIAERFSDKIILTNDNPRNEDPQVIFKEIVSGIARPDLIRVIPDRREAIRRAILESSPQDIVCIAGKGHEDYQILLSGKIDFSDRDVAQDVLDTYELARKS